MVFCINMNKYGFWTAFRQNYHSYERAKQILQLCLYLSWLFY